MLSQSREQVQDHGDGSSAVVLVFPVPDSETGLVAALRSAHPQAKRALCERYSGELLRIASRILGPDPSVRTIVVETLRWAMSHLDELDDPRSLGLWLRCRLVVLARRRLRIKGALRWLSDWGSAHWFDATHGSEQLASTYRVLDNLNVELRLALCLVVIDSMPWGEAAALLHLPSLVLKRRLIAAHAGFRTIAQRSFPELVRRHSSNARLGAEIAKEQDGKLGEGRIYDFELLRERGQRVMPAFTVVLMSLSALFAVCILSFVLWGSAMPPDTTSVGRWVVSPPQHSTTVFFNNGSKITLTPGSRLRVLKSNDRGDASVLESGSGRLKLGDANRTDAVVAAGPFLISVSQGEVELSWAAASEALEVLVHRGAATISGCQFGSGSSVEPGRLVRARCLALSAH